MVKCEKTTIKKGRELDAKEAIREMGKLSLVDSSCRVVQGRYEFEVVQTLRHGA
jgi:hypothetical protein